MECNNKHAGSSSFISQNLNSICSGLRHASTTDTRLRALKGAVEANLVSGGHARTLRNTPAPCHGQIRRVAAARFVIGAHARQATRIAGLRVIESQLSQGHSAIGMRAVLIHTRYGASLKKRRLRFEEFRIGETESNKHRPSASYPNLQTGVRTPPWQRTDRPRSMAKEGQSSLE
jgi:hypothetical protein